MFVAKDVLCDITLMLKRRVFMRPFLLFFDLILGICADIVAVIPQLGSSGFVTWYGVVLLLLICLITWLASVD